MQWKAGPGTFFIEKDNKGLTKTEFTKRIREALAEVGMDWSDISGHSFPIGAANSSCTGDQGTRPMEELGIQRLHPSVKRNSGFPGWMAGPNSAQSL